MKNILQDEITKLRDRIEVLYDQILLENNSDEIRHLQYSLEEFKLLLNEKMKLFNQSLKN